MMMENPTLKQILDHIPISVLESTGDLNISLAGVHYDSREIKPGYLFVAIEGGTIDGHNFIDSAVKNGAAAVAGRRKPDSYLNLGVPYLQFEDTKAALGFLSAGFYGFPSRSMVIIGVTGTDGKTTTANLIYDILNEAGCKTGMISTVNAQVGDEVLDTGFHVTTPEAPDVQYYLWRMKEAGLTHVVLEVTSHGLAQQRVTGVDFDIAVVTNITHEHFDYHKDYEGYIEAKGRLFEALGKSAKKSFFPNRLAVLNKDDKSFEYLKNITPVKQIHYSTLPGADVWSESIDLQMDGSRFKACSNSFEIEVFTHLPGEFNISNVLAALSATIFGINIEPATAAKGVESLKLVPGRMEHIDLGQDFHAIVDFAHTPNALENAIKTVRKITSGRVIPIFGSAGLRDRIKRRLMAETSAQLADITIITAEDPRTESLDDILQEMQKAAESKGAVLGENLFIVADRGKAIELGVELAQPGDVVMPCGKGHEQSMCFGEIEYLWDDRTALKAALAKRQNVPGPEMPYLPTQDNLF
jgi:UDP-N-acetylmuramoyl-L-alanyl-D-glutamate--2,6-diaminopimelate ligase